MHDVKFKKSESVFGKRKTKELKSDFEIHKNLQRSIEVNTKLNPIPDEVHHLTFLLLMIYIEIPEDVLKEIAMLNPEMIEKIDELEKFSRIKDQSKKFNHGQ